MPAQRTATPDAAPLTAIFDLLWGRDNPAIEGWREAVESWSQAWGRSMPPVWPWVAATETWRASPAPPAAPFRSHPAGKTIEELAVGDSAGVTKRITQADIDAFARVSGDDNPAHVDAAWAEGTRLGGRVAHGMLTAGLISAALGTKLPGPGSIYMSQTLRWVAPVRPGDLLTATVTVREIVPDKGRVVLDTVVSRDGEPVLTGEALVMPPPAEPRPAGGRAPRPAKRPSRKGAR
jgi:3-hydroxybutyryl-CoA dehydratase